MGVLTRELILRAKDLKVEDVPVPEWPDTDGSDGVVRIQQLSAKDVVLFQAEMARPESKSLGMFIILAWTAVDDAGARVFTVDDVAALQEKNFSVLDRLQRVALRVNSMLPENRAALKKDLSEVAVAASPSA